jgi:C-terminal processing protease CtpA/Prc
MRNMKENGVNGLIIDMRLNGGGSGFLARQMAAYFFQESLDLGNTGYYDEDRDEFYFDPRTETDFILPPDDLRYDGEVVVIVGPDCASACEFFSYAMSLQDRATIIGHYPTAGLGGSIDRVSMPEDIDFTFTQGRAVNAEGEIHIEGKGVAPDIDVPLTPEAVLEVEDVLLDTAVAHLQGDLSGGVTDGGAIAVGDTVSGSLASDERVRYTLSASEGDRFDITVAGETAAGEELDTVLNLYDEEENLLFSNDDAGEDTVSSAIQDIEIPFDLTLIVEVTTFEGSEGGAYTLSVSE